jgi:SNF2 family DNA or RNA helicase
MEEILDILETIPKEILINCANKLIFEKKEDYYHPTTPFIESESEPEPESEDLTSRLKRLTNQLTKSDADTDTIMKEIREIRNQLKSSNCISRSKIVLKDYQIKCINFIGSNDALLVVHGTGTGKTLTALAASQCFLDLNPNGKIIVISPASLIKNFEKEMPKYGSRLSSKYFFYSFTKFTSLNHKAYLTPFELFYRDSLFTFKRDNPEADSEELRYIMLKYFNNKIKTKKVVGPDEGMKRFEDNPKYLAYKMRADEINLAGVYDCRGAMVIIDEAHNLRNMGVRYKAMFDSIIKAKKILLLTATPFVNKIHDFVPLINILYRDPKILNKMNKVIPADVRQDDPVYYKTLNNLAQALKGKVSFYNEKDSDAFPKVRIHKIEVEMNMSFFREYEKALIDDKKFGDVPELYYNGFRRAVNAVGVHEYLNQKIDDVLSIIKKGHQTLIFTNWLEDGVEILTKVFEENDISYIVISGEVQADLRLSIVESFNLKRIQVLIITIAGSEGLDLKETRNVIILDPVWNKATIDQIIGRAVRYLSHSKLPIDQRYVDVYNLILKSPYKNVPSGDELLYEIINRKTEMLYDVEDILRDITI